MTALAADRNTPFRDGVQFAYPCAASKTFYKGALVFLDSSGNAEPATTATGKIAAGVSQDAFTSTSAAAEKVNVKGGVHRFVNGETITKAHIGDVAYADDDQTIMRTSTGRSAAGVIVDVDSDGVWVDVGSPLSAPTVGLLAANNLSDVGTVATARSNLGLDTADSPTFVAVIGSGASAVKGLVAAGGAAYTVLNASGNHTVETATDNAVITLPDTAAGNKGLRVLVRCTAANGAAKVSISPHSSDYIYGGVNGGSGGALVTFGGVVDKDAVLTKATALKGDYLELESDGSTGWYVCGGQGVWASEA